MTSRPTPLLFAATLLACQRLDAESNDGDGTTTTADADSTSTSTVTSGTPPPPTPLPDLPPPDDGFVFIGGTEMGGTDIECSIWEQDCLEGEKCMPWANDGGNSWNATKCTPLDPNPAGVGEPCVAEGSGVSGTDNCEIRAMCWNVDPETLEGRCIAFCAGTQGSPYCEDPLSECTTSDSSPLALCIPTCNPLGDECGEGEGCIPSNDRFLCIHVFAPGQYADPCEFANVCASGLFCANAQLVPGCEGSQGCCQHFCDLTLPVLAECVTPQLEDCLPWFAEGEAPPGLENVGACAIP